MRAFVAVETPAQGAGPAPATTAAPSHLTLAFLASVDDPRGDALVGAVAPAVRTVAPFELRFGGFDAFPDRGRPRVVYLRVAAGRSELARLATEVRDALDAAGFAFDRRPFVPHRTVLRVRSSRDLARARSLLAMAPSTGEPAFAVTEVQVKSSTLAPTGAVHTVIGRCPLASPGAPAMAP